MTIEQADAINKIMSEYSKVVHSISSAFFDSLSGFHKNLLQYDKLKKECLSQSNDDRPIEIQEQLYDSAWTIYADGDPNDPNTKPHHISTHLDYKLRNSDGGNNYEFLGNMALVLIYQYWEDHTRNKIAELFNIEPSFVQCDIFGDICKLRNSIIHNGGIGKEDIKRCKLFNWFQPNERIFIDRNKMIEILDSFKLLKIRIEEHTNAI